MFFVLASWIVIFVMISSVGGLTVVLLSRFTKALDFEELGIFEVFWIGFAAMIAFAQMISLFVPLDSRVLILWIGVALLALPLVIRHLKTAFSKYKLWHAANLCKIGVFILLAVPTIYYGANGVSTLSWSGAFDSDLYYFNALRWMNEYAAVPGLANLHSRLAYNSGFLILSAVLDNLWWDGRTAWLTHAFLVTVTGIQWLWVILAPAQDKKDKTIRQQLFCLLTFPYLAYLITSTTPTLFYDEAAFLVQLVLVAELLHFPLLSVVGENSERLPSNVVTWLMTVSSLAVLGFSIKPIGAISLVFVLLLSVAVLFAGSLRCRAGSAAIKPSIAVFAIVMAVIIGHVSRNAIQTGWLMYPAPIGNIKTDWALPEFPISDNHVDGLESVVGQYRIITAWARLPGPDYRSAISGFSWFRDWRQRVWHGNEPRLFYAGFMLCIIHLLWTGVTRPFRWPEALQDGSLIGLSMANLLFCVLSARLHDSF